MSSVYSLCEPIVEPSFGELQRVGHGSYRPGLTQDTEDHFRQSGGILVDSRIIGESLIDRR